MCSPGWQLLNSGNEASRALALFFVFSFLQARKRWLERAAAQQPAVSAPVPPPLPSSFLEALPVRVALQAMQSRSSPASILYPVLLPLVCDHMPQHRLPSGLLRQQSAEDMRRSAVGAALRWQAAAHLSAGPVLFAGSPMAQLDPLRLTIVFGAARTAPAAALDALEALARLPARLLPSLTSPLIDSLLPQVRG